MKKNNSIKEIYENATPFLEVYKDYNLDLLPNWIRNNINEARVSGKKNNSIIMPNGKRYNMANKVNHLSGEEWSHFINSVFVTSYPTKGVEAYAHNIRKIHPSPKPPQLMRDLIQFFTKENELIFDFFMGVGGTLLGASLCNRKAVGIDLSEEYIEAYKKACKELRLNEEKTYIGDSIELTSDKKFMDSVFDDNKIGLILIDPPYFDMMSRAKTGGDLKKYGNNGTPFTNSIKDLGNMNKAEFLKCLKAAISNTIPYLKEEGYIIIFIKDMQPKGEDLNMLHYDLAKEINSIDKVQYKGMRIWADDTAKLYPYGYPFCFVANQIHQYILIFRKEK